ncbi:MAG: ABC transporter permease [Bryobacterales bacterium]|nr:ABC transporter permease [Bryobacterales bacterium]
MRGRISDGFFLCRWLIRAAGLLAPGRERGAWTRRRLEEARQYRAFLQERGETPDAIRWKLRDFCRQAFAGGLRRRFPEGGPREAAVRLARSPRFFAAAVVVLLAGVALASGLFSGMRTLYGPLPYPDARRLVSCYQVHFLSLSWGVQSRYIKPWQEKSATLEGLAAYQVQNLTIAPPGSSERTEGGMRVTENFFTVLGVKPFAGRLFQPGDSAGEPLVVLSHKLWRTRFGSDYGVIGREMALEGAPARVAGVLPPGFWFRSHGAGVWTLLPDLSRPDPALRLVNAVGRMAPGVTEDSVRAELQQIAWSTSRFRGGAVRVTRLSTWLRPTLLTLLLSFLVGTVLALTIALIQFLRSWLQRGDAPWEALRYWAFFPLKTFLLLALMTVAGAELAARNALALQASKFVVSLVVDWASVLVTVLVVRWAILDQSRRCPVCLRRLALPVSSGSWGSSIFEPATTELLCDQGHGSLWYGEAPTTLGEIRRWIKLEDSWRELLGREDKS